MNPSLLIQKGLYTDDAPFPMRDLEAMYPHDQNVYKLRAAFALNFLIALGKPDLTICTYIQKLTVEKLQLPDIQNYNLTPLHVAAMKANLVVARALLVALKDNGQKLLNTKDAFGYTPMHHAALTSNSIFNLFLEYKGDPNLRTKSGANCQDLQIMAGRVSEIRSSNSLYVKEGLDADPLLISSNQELKKRIFGEHFFHTDNTLLSNQHFKELWHTDTPNEVESIERYLPKLYENYRANPPKLAITPCQLLKGVSEHFLEVQAMEEIPPGVVVAEYAGLKVEDFDRIPITKQFNDSYRKQFEYSGANADATELGNESRFFNCGFPNVASVGSVKHGIKRGLFISLKTIEKGEPILWSYGIKMINLVLGTQVILGKKEMETFFNKYGKTLIDTTRKIGKKQYKSNFPTKLEVEELYLIQGFLFPLENPTALLYLHFNKIVDCNFWSDLWKAPHENPIFQALRESYFDEVFLRLGIFGILNNVRKRFKEEQEHRQVAFWVLQKLEKVPLINILKGLDFLAKEEMTVSLPKQLDTIDVILKNYNWTQDPNSFLRIQEEAINRFHSQIERK